MKQKFFFCFPHQIIRLKSFFFFFISIFWKIANDLNLTNVVSSIAFHDDLFLPI